MVSSLESLSSHFNICIISVLDSVDYLFSLEMFLVFGMLGTLDNILDDLNIIRLKFLYIFYLSRWSTCVASKYMFWFTFVGCLSNANLIYKSPAVNLVSPIVCYSDDRTLPHSPHSMDQGGGGQHHRGMMELRDPSACPLGKDIFSLVQGRGIQQRTTHKLHQVCVPPLLGVGWMPKFCPKSLCRRITASPCRRRVMPEIYSQPP